MFCLLAAVGWVICLLALIWVGFALPANAAAAACTQAVQQVSALTAQQVEEAELDPLCRYAVFAGPDSLQPLDTNMDPKHLQRAMEYWQGQRSPRWGYAQYYLRAELAGGGVCLFQFDYAMPYADPALRSCLPDLQTLHFVLGLLLLAGVIALCTRRAGRFLSAETARLTEASRRVAAQQLDPAAFSGARVREYHQALGALQQMARQLTDSLQAQWRMEQHLEALRAVSAPALSGRSWTARRCWPPWRRSAGGCALRQGCASVCGRTGGAGCMSPRQSCAGRWRTCWTTGCATPPPGSG